MATAVKAAAFAALFRVLGEAFAAVPAWHTIVWWLAVATMVVGNLIALAQRTLKRMLAYSSIAHAGYLLVAVATGTAAGAAAFLFYLLAYTLMTLAAFALLAAKGTNGERDVRIDDLAGLAQRRPWLALALAVCMLSLLGIPGTAATLKPKPTSSSPSPISSIGLCCRPSVATCTPMRVRFVVAVAPYTSAMPYSRKPEANAPNRKYLSAASAPAALRRLLPASTYSAIDMSSRPRNSTIRSWAAAISIIPRVANSNSAKYSGAHNASRSR